MNEHAPNASASMFLLGQIVTTANALNSLHRPSVDDALRRHASCDWGTLCVDDAAENARALVEGGRLFSVYDDQVGVRFWIITESDRSATTVLLPEDY